jgi:hypothetical protein
MKITMTKNVHHKNACGARKIVVQNRLVCYHPKQPSLTFAKPNTGRLEEVLLLAHSFLLGFQQYQVVISEI